jgi:tetratricopeptide (TPR) repeat protein
MYEGFDFSTPALAQHLTGKLAVLKSYNALRVHAEYFDEAMTAPAREISECAARYGNTPALRYRAASRQIPARRGQCCSYCKRKRTDRQEWFERGFKANDPNEQIRCYTEAIRLNSDYAAAYNNRGISCHAKGDLDLALKDLTEAIRLNPDCAKAYYNRGNARRAKGDLDGALKDYTEAIRLKPDYAFAYYNRALVWRQKADQRAAIADFQKYLDLGEGIRSGNQATVEKFIRDLKQYG